MSKKYSEKIWSIQLSEASGSPKTIELCDGNAVLGEYIQIRRNYFDDLIKEIKLNKKYTVSKSLKEVTSPKGENWTENPLILIVAHNKEKDVPIWLLLKRENNLNGYLIAIGPDVFCEYISKEQEKIEEIRKFLEYMVIYSLKWEILALIPTFLE
ncbi:MAG: hypothetical protein EU530_07775 [Promethearchaeota archaeon]|nr:MAG: hypothetical protein EU530_07775 [Candidatus Lokiarchaeota archaeon]